MYKYVQNNHRQQIEIMRRCTATALHDVFEFTEEQEDFFKILFFHASGISTIALLSGCTEVEVMKKIQKWDLYSWFQLPNFQDQLRENNAAYDEMPESSNEQNQNFRRVQMMRKATSGFDCSKYQWTNKKLTQLHWFFCIGEDISQIALALGCTELMVMQRILDEGYYNSMDYPLFSLSCQLS